MLLLRLACLAQRLLGAGLVFEADGDEIGHEVILSVS